METRPKIKLTINGKEVLTDPGLTILDVARDQGIDIPTLCHHPALSSHGGCRMCVVEVDGAGRLAASCVTPVRDGMHVVTENDRIVKSRRALLEFLFAERNHHCMFCPQSGDCELQRLAYALGMDHLSVPQSFREFPVDVTSNAIGIDHNRCILCGRCVRVCEEISGCHVLNFHNRGPQTLIGFDLSETREKSSCYSCGACLQVCPTGAIFNRQRTHLSVKGRPAETKTTSSVCPLCGCLCPTLTTADHHQIVKVEGDLSAAPARPDRGRLCGRGRFDVLKTAGDRIRHPMMKEKDGNWRQVAWEHALDTLSDRLRAVEDRYGGKSLAGIASSGLSNEELILFRELMRGGFSAGRIDTLDGRHFRKVRQVEEKTGGSMPEASWKSIIDADFVLMLGVSDHGGRTMLPSLAQQAALQKGVITAQIGPPESRLPYVACFLPAPNGDIAPLLRAFKKQALGAVPQSPNRGRKRPDVRAADASEFFEAVKAFAGAESPLIVVGRDFLDRETAESLHLAAELAAAKGTLPGPRRRWVVEKPCGNSAGAWKLGLAAAEEPERPAAWKAGFLILGEEKTIGEPFRSGLKRAEFLAVVSAVMPVGLPACPCVLLPKPLWTEESGTYTSLDGTEVGCLERVLPAPDGVRDTWQTLTAVADRIGYDTAWKNWHELRKAATLCTEKRVTPAPAAGGSGG